MQAKRTVAGQNFVILQSKQDITTNLVSKAQRASRVICIYSKKAVSENHARQHL